MIDADETRRSIFISFYIIIPIVNSFMFDRDNNNKLILVSLSSMVLIWTEMSVARRKSD